jgi:L-lactate utilization protein LutB
MTGAAPGVRALGLPAAFRLVSRSGGDLAGARDLLAACRACAACAPRCPAAIPFDRVLEHLAARAGLPGR